MKRRIGATWMLYAFSVAACQYDSRDPAVVEGGLLPGEGASTAGALSVQPSSVAYGPITVGFAASARLLVQNTGSTRLAAPEVSLGGAGASAFTITQNDCTAALPSGADCSIGLAFRPSDLSARAATLTVGGAAGSVSIGLSGSGLEAGGLLLEAAPGSDVRFGDVPLDGELEATLRLSNPTGRDSGAVEWLSNNPAFSLLPPQGSECAASGARLAAGQSCDFRVRFAPALRGVTDGTITARSEASGSVSLGVSGNALSPARVVADPGRLEFGDVVVAGTAVLDLVISNGGDEPLPPVTSAVTGADASVFRVTSSGCSAPLSARESCSVVVSFSPRETGPHDAVLGLDAGSAGTLGIGLAGAGLPQGDLRVTAATGNSSDFGSVVLGAERQQVFRVSNPSSGASGPLQLTLNSREFAIVPASGAECVSGVTDLAAGASCDLRVGFAPSQRRERNATLTVASAIGGTVLNLRGVGLAPAALEADGPLDFGGVSVGTAATRSLRVSNSGDGRVAAVSASIAGPDASSFTLQQNGCGAGLAALGTCSLSVAFDPALPGSHLATLLLAAESGSLAEQGQSAGEASGTREVALIGRGLEPGALQLVPGVGGSTLFEDVLIGSGQAQTQTFILSNSGEVSSGTISIVPPGGGFEIAEPAGADCVSGVTRLEPDQSCTIRVEFSPSARGPDTASLTVTSASAGSASLTLSGTGLGPALLAAEPVPLSFDMPVPVGDIARAEITLINRGDTPTGIIEPSIVALTAGFSVGRNTCGGPIAAGGSCELDVAFAPTASGLHSASVRVESTPGGVISVPVSGTGNLPASVTLSATESTDFGSVGLNASSTRSFILSNDGDVSAGRLLGISLGFGFALAPRVGDECQPNFTLLDSKASCGFRVNFQPSTTSNFAVTMVATTALGGTSSLGLTGQGVAPPALRGSPATLSFVSSVFPGNQGSETLTWTISNAGGSPTEPLTFSNSNPQEIRSFPLDCQGLRLAPGDDCLITMQLAPLVAGTRTATFTVTSGNQSVSVIVSGVGG